MTRMEDRKPFTPTALGINKEWYQKYQDLIEKQQGEDAKRTLERLSRNHVGAPVFVRFVEARLPQASVLVFLMSGPVAKDRAVVVRLNLPNGPAILADLEVPD